MTSATIVKKVSIEIACYKRHSVIMEHRV